MFTIIYTGSKKFGIIKIFNEKSLHLSKSHTEGRNMLIRDSLSSVMGKLLNGLLSLYTAKTHLHANEM